MTDQSVVFHLDVPPAERQNRSMLFDAVLLTHSWLRWVVVLGGILTLTFCTACAVRGGVLGSQENRLLWAFDRTLLYQALIGLVLLGVRPPQPTTSGFLPTVHALQMSAVVGIYHLARRTLPWAPPRKRPLAAGCLVAVTMTALLLLIPWSQIYPDRQNVRLP